MSLLNKEVYGAESFYNKAALRSGFFVVDTLLLVVATTMNLYILLRLNSAISFYGGVRLTIVLAGMWLLWAYGLAMHHRIHSLDQQQSAAAQHLRRTAASLTHFAMFITYLLVNMLLVEVGSLLRHTT